ncbi:NAD(P)-binding protein [Virgibacillus xinjiangensis]|uniref:precorrin-2 dehydrogenase n=1 Tax=Virgibacillus xinjiangensis TaxID=393090 RepID=A0ABV7CZ46_9BACI
MAVTPLMIDLNEKQAVIVGGGLVAARRAQTLLEGGAKITIVSPDIHEILQSEWEKGRLLWEQKQFEPGDLDDAFLIIAATNQPEVNESVIQAAPPNTLVNAAADAKRGNVEFPSFFRRGNLSISVSTNGASPGLSSKIKVELQQEYNEDYEAYVDFLAESRKLIKHSPLEPEHQRFLLKELLADSFLRKDKQLSAMKWFRNLAKEGETG